MVDEFAGMDEAEDNAEPALVAPGGEEKEESSAMLNADPVCQGTSKDVEDVVSATSAPAGAIRPIDRGVVHQICSGQVVLTLATAVKELLENSIDAGATAVDIRLVEHGSVLIEVTDNGSGVEESNMAGLTLKHHTSKIREFTDLASVETFGFRGEALSSLCALAKVTITTRHAATSQTGTCLSYDHNGVEVERSSIARGPGTTVALHNLFSTMPVRHREFLRNIKKEFSKLVSVVSGYALVSEGVRITCSNQVGKGKRTTVVATQGRSVKDNLVAVFGAKQASTLMPFRQAEGEVDDVGKVEGWVSSPRHGEGRGAPDRQFYFFNNRPCDPARLSKAVNQVYHTLNRHQFPFVFLNVHTERQRVDVNLTPDKRQVLVQREKVLVEGIRASLEAMWADCPAIVQLQNLPSKLQLQGLQQGGIKSQQGGTKRGILQAFASPTSSSPQRIEEGKGNKPEKRQRTLANFLEPKTCDPEEDDKESFAHPSLDAEAISKDAAEESSCEKEFSEEKENRVQPKEIENDNSGFKITFETGGFSEPFAGLEFFDTPPKSQELLPSLTKEVKGKAPENDEVAGPGGLKISFEPMPSKPHNVSSLNSSTSEINTFQSSDETEKREIGCCIPTSEICDTEAKPLETLTNVSSGCRTPGKLENVSFSFQLLKCGLAKQSKEEEERKVRSLKFKAKIEPGENSSAEEELNKQIKKTDFARMEIFGQFNLGFLIVGLGKDLFIVDQHATDEKYNFETLQRTTHIRPQKMVVAQGLELTAGDEATLIDHLEVFEKNGFQFEVDKESAAGRRVKLVAVPTSKNWVFGKEDIDELIFMLSDTGGDLEGASIRPSRVRAMFASRACRTSVMVGTALSKADMRRLITHMGQIEQPWNCPHGRPTLRHLVNTDMISQESSS